MQTNDILAHTVPVVQRMIRTSGDIHNNAALERFFREAAHRYRDNEIVQGMLNALTQGQNSEFTSGGPLDVGQAVLLDQMDGLDDVLSRMGKDGAEAKRFIIELAERIARSDIIAPLKS